MQNACTAWPWWEALCTLPCCPTRVLRTFTAAGDFIEDDDGNFMDMGGEEEYWQGEEGAPGSGDGKKRKDGGAAAGACGWQCTLAHCACHGSPLV